MQAQGVTGADPVANPAPGLPAAAASPAAPGAAASRERERDGTGGAAPGADRERFRALVRRKSGSARDASSDAGAALASGSVTFEPRLREVSAPAAPLAPRAVDAPVMAGARVLVGQGTAAHEARIDLRGGALAGTSIHVSSRADGIEVRIGAGTDETRETLARLVDHVGLRLRSRGIVMRTGRALETRARDREREQPRDGHGSAGGS